MHNQLITNMPLHDPRDPVVEVRDYPDPPIHLVSSQPRIAEAIADASLHRAISAQRQDRRKAMEAIAEDAQADLLRSAAIDSLTAERVAVALMQAGDDRSVADRRQAGAIATRLHDPRWMQIGRYRHASQNLISLRNLLSRHGLSGLIPDRELRACADGMAGAGWLARLAVLDGSQPAGLHEYCAAVLGFHSICEER